MRSRLVRVQREDSRLPLSSSQAYGSSKNLALCIPYTVYSVRYPVARLIASVKLLRSVYGIQKTVCRSRASGIVNALAKKKKKKTEEG